MMHSPKNHKMLTCIAYFSMYLGIILMFVYIIIYVGKASELSMTSLCDFIYNQIISNTGEFVGGTIGVIFTLTATLFLFITFKEQRLQFEITQKTEFCSRFETTYFNILSMLKQVQETVNKNIISSNSEYNSITDYYNSFKKKYKGATSTSLANSEEYINDNEQNNPATIQRASQTIGDLYKEFVTEENANIGYFYRYIYNVIKFVYEEKRINSIKEKQNYLNLLQAQLSDEELALVFYDAISEFGENKQGDLKFHEMVDKLQFLENIRESVLLNRNHFKFYPHTHFKFNHRGES